MRFKRDEQKLNLSFDEIIPRQKVIKKHKKNILIGVGTLIVLILSTVLIKHKKNRGVLQWKKGYCFILLFL